MAWNEPGGNNNKDPWNNPRGGDQGPPDLDEVFKKLFAKFGGNKSGGSSTGSATFAIIALLLAAFWGLSGFYTVKEAERSVLLTFGKFSDIVEPGLRWKATFIQKQIPIDINTVRSKASSGSMLTEDQNLVTVEMEIQYIVLDPYKYIFATTEPEVSLSHALDAAIRYVVGHSKLDSLLTQGKEVARQMVWEELNRIIEPYDLGLAIEDVNFRNVRPPAAVKEAFDDAIAAQEDEQTYIRQAEAYSRAIEPEARGQVSRMLQEAEAYKQRVTLEAEGEVARFLSLLPQFEAAPEVTRQRLYLETLEQVYSNTSKIMVDSGKGGNNMMYLPLDKILERQNNTSSTIPRSNSVTESTLEALRNANTTNSRPVTSSRDAVRTGRN
ncbi:FtsH protease activity modulator HflK [Bowmanella sp. JS7-9]|uniref:Protein HflK n=1 Tax=Pseudobowmanella zhangzhouensis TaxID=1537679 RepID=A0ABW1XNN4_9ALTE|nr:FtsH protease activity modulator HflK [Bowmanella sp. JS7-9]TBX23795.1 membrane protease HflK [Bowmanella sp. JS7-9]